MLRGLGRNGMTGLGGRSRSICKFGRLGLSSKPERVVTGQDGVMSPAPRVGGDIAAVITIESGEELCPSNMFMCLGSER